MKMPFGRYKNRQLSRIPDGYLVWILDNCVDLSPTLRTAIHERLGRETAGRRAMAVPDMSAIRIWYRELAFDFHPDRGGSDEALKALNEAYLRLLDTISVSPVKSR